MKYPSFIRLIKQLVLVVLATSGILLDRITPLRAVLLFLIVSGFLLQSFLMKVAGLTFAVCLFAGVFIARYLFLFLSFIKHGIADRLKERYGEELGYAFYEFATALLFFAGGSSFALLVNKSNGIFVPSPLQHSPFLMSLGMITMLVGLVVNIWSTIIIGVETYYYKDLFLGRQIVLFQNRGPYSLLANPMYTLGQAWGYGTAVLFFSAIGIAGILLNQGMMFIFYAVVEKPHIDRILKLNSSMEPNDDVGTDLDEKNSCDTDSLIPLLPGNAFPLARTSEISDETCRDHVALIPTREHTEE
jgi:hypothetical protein